jgi:hypothetical protein
VAAVAAVRITSIAALQEAEQMVVETVPIRKMLLVVMEQQIKVAVAVAAATTATAATAVRVLFMFGSGSNYKRK